MTLIEVELQGFDAYHDGLTPDDSPYPAGSPQDSAWRSGHMTAFAIALYRHRPWPLDHDRAPTIH